MGGGGGSGVKSCQGVIELNKHPGLQGSQGLGIITRNFGTDSEFGRHEWFALRRSVTNSRNFALTGGYWNNFLKETLWAQNWIMKKSHYMEHCGSGTLQPVKVFNMADRRIKLKGTQLPQHCPCWKFRNFLLRNKARIYLQYFKNDLWKTCPSNM